ncbi:hypothetical protein S83_023065 [Arachis hypogaea]
MGSPQADARSAQVPKHASGRALPSTIATMTYPRAYRRPGLGPPSQSASVDAPSRLADQRRRSTSDRGASPAPIRFPPDNFKHSLTLFSKSFSSFPRGTCSLSVSLSGPDRHALTRTLHRRSGSVGGATPGGIPPISFLAPRGFIHPLTRTHVRLLGPCFKTGRMGSPQADARSAQVPKHASGRALPSTIATMTYPRAYRRPGLGPPSQSASVDAPSRLADQRRRSTSDRGASPAPIRFPPDNFKHSLTLFSKSFSSFPRGTCSLSVSRQYLALDGIYRPIRAAFPNNPTRRQRLVVRQGPGTTGLSPSLAPPSRGLGPGPPLRTLLQTTIQTPGATDSHAGLFPVRSPLLGESSLVSFPPLIDMLKLSG